MVRVLLLILFLIPKVVLSQEIKAELKTDSTNYLIGDYIGLSIRVSHPSSIEVFYPSLKDSLKTLELISQDFSTRKEAENKILSEYKYVLIGFDSGDVFIPTIAVPFRDKSDTTLNYAWTNSAKITIHTVAVDTTADIKDIKEPIKFPLNYYMILLWVLIGLCVILVGIFLYKKFYKKKVSDAAEVELKKLPHEKALESLQVLESKKLWQNGLIKEYHTEITEIIRRYFEERFNLPALEMTTREVLEKLQISKEAEPILEITKDFLNNADMVKFAKFIPMNSVNEEMMKQAYKIVEDTKQEIEQEVNKVEA
ncbi:MAG: hypothetical protein N3A61_07585 [Ignavibacteria bacterium]|nr:hypothetical protein [Ignavibacteria bacterium]